ncbi:hypothetical protein DTO021C3_3910 [Paecilomyces variotii]|nr:hypothetical protein DTO021C3_3910 [Paecilomyces variotii]
MSSLIIGPPPAGIDLKENRTPSNNATVGVVMGIATFFVAVRFYSRTTNSGTGLGADDWMTLVSLVFAYGTGICCILGGEYGIGKHIWSVPEDDDVLESMKIIFAYVILYANTVPVVKYAVLLLYRRIFDLTWSLYICAFLAFGYALSVSVTISVACKPSSFFWTQWVNPLSGGKCTVNLYQFYLWNAVGNLLTDVLILCLPIPIVWGLQMSVTKRLAVIGIFMLGGFVCVATIVRIYSITQLKDTVDITWAIGDAMIWSNVEPCIGIVSACLPTMRPALRQVLDAWGISHFRSSNNTDGAKASGSANQGGRRMVPSTNRHSYKNITKTTFRPDDDEVYLTTDIARAESVVNEETSQSNKSGGFAQESIGMNITVKQSFYQKQSPKIT